MYDQVQASNQPGYPGLASTGGALNQRAMLDVPKPAEPTVVEIMSQYHQRISELEAGMKQAHEQIAFLRHRLGF